MAKQRDSKLVGTVGNLIFYNFRGEYCMRAKPASVRRTKASVNSGFNFGKASRMSRQIRSLIEPINPSKSDIQVSYRLTGALNQFISWKEKQDPASIDLKSVLPFIDEFQFNDQANLTDIFAIKVSVKTTEPGLMEISLASFIPSQSLHAPRNTSSILFNMILTGTSLIDVETELLGTVETEIPYTGETFQQPVISIPVVAKPGDLAIMVMSVRYLVNKNDKIEMLTDKKKLPCGIAWAGLY
jgi:hypothetical protein